MNDPDLIDALIEFKKELIQRKLATDNENEKEVYNEVSEELSNIILEHQKWSVPF